MISKATWSTVSLFSVPSLILIIGLSVGITACAPEGAPTEGGQGVSTEEERGSELDIETSAIINGQSVGAGGAPHEKAVLGVQMLTAEGEPSGDCSAVLIRADAILLAAHCFDPEIVGRPVHMIVHTNHDLNRLRVNDPASRRITRKVMHPLYNSLKEIVDGMKPPHYDNDVAIAFLDRPFITTRPQPLASESDVLIPGMTLTVYGYGRSFDWVESSRSKAAKRTKTRQRGTLVISDRKVLIKSLSTADSKSSVCQGDSGGPAYLIERGKAPVVMALNSGSNGEIYVPGTNMRRCRGESVMLPVAPYRAWIDQTLMENRR